MIESKDPSRKQVELLSESTRNLYLQGAGFCGTVEIAIGFGY